MRPVLDPRCRQPVCGGRWSGSGRELRDPQKGPDDCELSPHSWNPGAGAFLHTEAGSRFPKSRGTRQVLGSGVLDAPPWSCLAAGASGLSMPVAVVTNIFTVWRGPLPCVSSLGVLLTLSVSHFMSHLQPPIYPRS